MPDVQINLRPENYYHIYNHAVGDDNLFDSKTDYDYFLNRLKKYILPIGEVMAYCLMPNHFHLVVRIRDQNTIKSNDASGTLFANSGNEDDLSKGLSRVFSNFFNTYAKYYNFHKSRRGTLFKRAFRRKEIRDTRYLQDLICYVHQNPVEAGFVDQPADWKYSSYNPVIGSHLTLIPKQELADLFGDVENFIYCHSRQVEIEF